MEFELLSATVVGPLRVFKCDKLEDEGVVGNEVDGADATDTDCNIHGKIIRPTEM